MKFNRKKFFDGFKANIDSSLEQEQVNGLEFLLSKMEDDPLWRDVRHIAYAFATTGHETAWSFQPVEEGYYLGSKAKVVAFQKSLRYYPYFGRGYVQLTWETKKIPNYSKASKALGVDFVNKPELVMVPENAYKILTLGMHQGWFTGKKLTDFISGSKVDYKNARKIINGLDKATLIAGYAKQFESILRASLITSKEEKIVAPTPESENGSEGQETPKNVPPGDNNSPPSSLVPVATPVIEVEQLSAASDQPQNQESEGVIAKLGNKANAIYTAVSGFGAGIVAWFSGASTEIIIGATVMVCVLGGLYMIINWRRAENKDTKDRADRLEREKLETEKILKREQQAFELQKLTLESAMRPDLNTVRLVPPPVQVPNSDTN